MGGLTVLREQSGSMFKMSTGHDIVHNRVESERVGAVDTHSSVLGPAFSKVFYGDYGRGASCVVTHRARRASKMSLVHSCPKA